ncbi:MAG: histidinol phosphate phosphatase domain-containing protein [Chloroflexi bacterium]|nr:histidinol phosphate phosphatase domain-containing protein [Chloroflexota bacterium]MCY3938458.1 histidinol phosphate phosphatase domain-containing protein [Chloroflexota bacterium]
MLYDFHTHTFLSDGVLSPLELSYRCYRHGYDVLAITDHAGIAELDRLLGSVVESCRTASDNWDLRVLPGVELTYVPPSEIDLAALRAKELGAEVVVVHGETVSEDVPPGTNRAAAASHAVDVIAHPGLLDYETAEMARDSGKFIELSGRSGHSLANGFVASVCRKTGAPMIVNSDAHGPGDILTADRARTIAHGAGLSESEAAIVLEENPRALLRRLGIDQKTTPLVR